MSSGYKSPYNCGGRRREGRVGVWRESVCERVGWVCVWEEGRVCVRGEGVCV